MYCKAPKQRTCTVGYRSRQGNHLYQSQDDLHAEQARPFLGLLSEHKCVRPNVGLGSPPMRRYRHYHGKSPWVLRRRGSSSELVLGTFWRKEACGSFIPSTTITEITPNGCQHLSSNAAIRLYMAENPCHAKYQPKVRSQLSRWCRAHRALTMIIILEFSNRDQQ
jgi:hypothetical protein